MDIKIKGAYANNLKHVDLTLPKNKLIAFTGVSGSGKSTMALETIQRECQRLYMESLGMTMQVGGRAKVERIEGLSPAISITQHQSNNNPRSSVGTITELTSYIRVLFAHLGAPPEGEPITDLTPNHFSYNKPEGACPCCRGLGKLNLPDIRQLIDHSKSIREFAVHGWDQAYVDRYGAALMAAAEHYGFSIDIDVPVAEYDEVQMELLCHGVLSEQFAARFPDTAPPKTVPSGRFEGVVTNILRRYGQSNISAAQKRRLERFFIRQTCPECGGSRWPKRTLAITVDGENIRSVLGKSIADLCRWAEALRDQQETRKHPAALPALSGLLEKAGRLNETGIGYLSLDQPAGALSSGEWQRIKLAAVMGSGLTGVLYVLDEPSAGLHPEHLGQVIKVLKALRDLGNTVLVIEHNPEIIRAADHIVDFGPGAGAYGGTIVACGTPEQICRSEASLTGRCLAAPVSQPDSPRRLSGGSLKIAKAALHNLKEIDLEIPLNALVGITGVSGSGKTNLIFGVLARSAENYFRAEQQPVKGTVTGLEQLEDVVLIDHSSVGRSSRSNPATYTDVFTDIREVFGQQAAKSGIGLQARHFSANTPGGRCEECQGSGSLTVQMHFLPDIPVVCPSCRGKRYQDQVLAVTCRGYNIAQVLEMSIDQAAEVFRDNQKIYTKLRWLQEVGLGYLGLGQPTSTLSGGEAQRLKLAKELMKQGGGRRLYLFDEPTTGLHPDDVRRMIRVFKGLVERGSSVIVIEHNLSVVLAADHLIELGPHGGKAGGRVLTAGTPAQLAGQATATGQALGKWLSGADVALSQPQH